MVPMEENGCFHFVVVVVVWTHLVSAGLWDVTAVVVEVVLCVRWRTVRNGRTQEVFTKWR